MAARPNSQRTLEYGLRLATNHLTRLDEMMEMTERALEENRLLSPEDVTAYKACLRAGKKQRTQFRKVLDIALPAVNTATTRRKRGRPSKAELAELDAQRNGKAAAKSAAPPRRRKRKSIAVPVEAAPAQKRGRPKGSKNKPKVVAEAAAPKKRGRPKGSKNKPKVVEVVATAPKKRGRPKGSKNKSKTSNGMSASNGAADPAKRKRGRPKGSKNKPKTTAVAA